MTTAYTDEICDSLYINVRNSQIKKNNECFRNNSNHITSLPERLELQLVIGRGNLTRSDKIKALSLLQAICILCIKYTLNIHVAVYEKKKIHTVKHSFYKFKKSN